VGLKYFTFSVCLIFFVGLTSLILNTSQLAKHTFILTGQEL